MNDPDSREFVFNGRRYRVRRARPGDLPLLDSVGAAVQGLKVFEAADGEPIDRDQLGDLPIEEYEQLLALVRAAGEQLPPLEEQLSAQRLEVTASDPEAFLEELQRTLAPHGIRLVTDHGGVTISGPADKAGIGRVVGAAASVWGEQQRRMFEELRPRLADVAADLRLQQLDRVVGNEGVPDGVIYDQIYQSTDLNHVSGPVQTRLSPEETAAVLHNLEARRGGPVTVTLTAEQLDQLRTALAGARTMYTERPTEWPDPVLTDAAVAGLEELLELLPPSPLASVSTFTDAPLPPGARLEDGRIVVPGDLEGGPGDTIDRGTIERWREQLAQIYAELRSGERECACEPMTAEEERAIAELEAARARVACAVARELGQEEPEPLPREVLEVLLRQAAELLAGAPGELAADWLVRARAALEVQ